MMKKMKMTTVALLAILSALAGGCSGNSGEAAAQPVKLAVSNIKYDTAQMNVKVGEPVQLTFTNHDTLLHDFSIDKIPVKNVKEEQMTMNHDMGGTDPDLHLAVDAGKSGSVAFTPTKSGSYTYYCTVPGHKGAGMTGTLVVQ